jgi:type II secretory pathway predicted ATPase ExeA
LTIPEKPIKRATHHFAKLAKIILINGEDIPERIIAKPTLLYFSLRRAQVWDIVVITHNMVVIPTMTAINKLLSDLSKENAQKHVAKILMKTEDKVANLQQKTSTPQLVAFSFEKKNLT